MALFKLYQGCPPFFNTYVLYLTPSSASTAIAGFTTVFVLIESQSLTIEDWHHSQLHAPVQRTRSSTGARASRPFEATARKLLLLFAVHLFAFLRQFIILRVGVTESVNYAVTFTAPQKIPTTSYISSSKAS